MVVGSRNTTQKLRPRRIILGRRPAPINITSITRKTRAEDSARVGHRFQRRSFLGDGMSV